MHFKTPSPHIPWNTLPLRVSAERQAWPRSQRRRIAGVSSFGFSGTNAHVIIEEAPGDVAGAAVAAVAEDRPAHVLVLSARHETALRELATHYAAVLDAPSSGSLPDLCFSAAAGRSHFDHRLAVVGASAAEMRDRLTGYLADPSNAGVFRGRLENTQAPDVALLFTGQGSQYAGMGRELYQTQPAFRAALDQCAEALGGALAQPLLDVLYGPAAGDLDQTGNTQPALFAVEYALAAMWQSWGLRPAVVMGHSVGEYVAACVAGVLSLEDALTLVAARGRLMQALPGGGAMAAIGAGEEAVRAALAAAGGAAEIAAVNGPASVVIAGPEAAVEHVRTTLGAAGVRTDRLVVSHAFHSALMEPMLAAFSAVASAVTYHAPRIGIVSNVSGDLVSDLTMSTPEYWVRHVRQAVQFAAGMRTLAAQGCDVIVEAGPAPTLLGLGRACVPDSAAAWVPSLRRGRGAWTTLLDSLATLYARGVPIDWAGFDRGHGRRKVDLPTYPFQRERYWPESARRIDAHVADAVAEGSGDPLLGRRLETATSDVVFESRLSTAAVPFLADHRLRETAVFPATGYIAMALAGARETLGTEGCALEDFVIHEPLVIPAEAACTVQTVLSPRDADVLSFKIVSRDSERADRGERGDAWRVHATGNVRAAELPGAIERLEEIRTRCTGDVDLVAQREQMRDAGLNLGPAFQGVERAWRGDGEALGEIRLPEPAGDGRAFAVHPALLDACFQVLGAALPGAGDGEGARSYLPLGVARLRIAAQMGAAVWSHVRLVRQDGANAQTITADIALYGARGQAVGLVEGLQLKRATTEALKLIGRPNTADWLYEVEWQKSSQQSAVGSPQSAASGAWLIFGGGGLGAGLAKRLTADGATCVAVIAGGSYAVLADGSIRIDAANPDDFERLLRDAQAQTGKPLRGAVHLWTLDSPAAFDSRALAAALERSCGSVLHAAQVLSKQEGLAGGFWVITRGAQPANAAAGESSVAVAQSPVWGLCRTIAEEQPDLRCVLVDLDPAADAESEEEAGRLWQEMRAGADTQVAFRGGARLVPRLVRKARGARRGSPAMRLDITERGVLANLKLQPVERRAPEAGEVEIRVRASGLNFRDVLNALGMYPGDPGLLGNECAGTVVAVGPGVEHPEVGDEVVAIAAGTFASYVTTQASTTFASPANLNAEEAATVPITFLTAEYALNHLAHMAEGERVLIHAGAGGVGIAAIQLARQAGAEIFATAGSPEKRQFLQSLGVHHVLDSRSLAFAGEIMRITGGEGIDIVLNSLAGDFIPKSLGTLRAGGRFLELGKTGIWSAADVAALGSGLAYHVIFLGEVDPVLLQSMFARLRADFVSGALTPLPHRAFSLAQAADAFRFMAQAKHIGKLGTGPGRSGRRCAGAGDRS